MSINNLRESPIPPHPEGWGLLGQRVETALNDAVKNVCQNCSTISALRVQISELEARLAEYRKPIESMNTQQLSEWSKKLAELLSAPDDEREYMPWQITVGDHLEKFAKSWNSPRIMELEAMVATDEGELEIARRLIRDLQGKKDETALMAAIDDLMKQVKDLKEIAIGESERRHISDMSRFGFVLDSEFCPDPRKLAIDQLSEEHPEVDWK